MSSMVDRQTIDTVVIGAGQAGLAVSYYLVKAKRAHIVLEQDQIGSTWQTKRWDSFTLVTPNWMNTLPAFVYGGPNPDGFLLRDEVVKYLQDYARSFDAPVTCGAKAKRVSLKSDGSGYLVETHAGIYDARNVVVATGYFDKNKIPEVAGAISKSIEQIHSSDYRNPESLRPGAVMVVGSAQSGCQIAEDLREAGRDVYLSVGNAGRQPRRYRGKDICYWVHQMGLYAKTFKDAANPVERYQPNPHCSGKYGGHALNLENFAANGITLLGRIQSAHSTRLVLLPDLMEKVAKADQFSKFLMNAADAYIKAMALQVPEPDGSNTDDGTPKARPRIEEFHELDLAERSVTTIIWATGYTCDFSWIDLPIFDGRGYPSQTRGVSAQPGLYFCGLHWMHTLKSGLIFGVGDDALHVSRHLLDNR